MIVERAHQDPRLDEAGLRAFLTAEPDVVAAYVFGSLAADRATPRSDVDIAVLLDERLEPSVLSDRRLQLMGQLERFADRAVDVVVLNTASPTLQHQVLRHGRLLYEDDRKARVDFEVRAGTTYADLQPMRDLFKNALFQEIREGNLGGHR